MTESKQNDNDQASIDLLEKSIQDNSPEFLKELESISEIGSENLDLELVDIDFIMAQQKARSFKARAKRFLTSFSQLALKVSYFVKASALAFLKEKLPQYLKSMVAGLKVGLGHVGHSIGNIKKFSGVQKIAMIIVLVGCCGLAVVLYKVFTVGLIKDDEKLFVHSMEELSEHKYIFEPTEAEPFYNSPRVSQNIMSLRRIVVNVQKSKNSGPNPMGAFEFFLQGNSSDVMVEISDREAELLDLFQIEVRDFSYDELDTVEGKRRMTDKLTRAMNGTLTKGKITQIYFKNFVLKK